MIVFDFAGALGLGALSFGVMDNVYRGIKRAGGKEAVETIAEKVDDVLEAGAKHANDVAGSAVNKDARKVISDADRVKISSWKYAPDEDLYLRYKDVYDNPKYFDQKTGDAIYPGMNGDPNVAGFTNGQYKIETLKPGTIIDRYGSNPEGKYFSPAGSSYESRALPPYMESQPYNKYELLRPIEVKSGEVAPWFGQSGKGTQYLTDISIQSLIDDGYIRIIT